MRPAPCDRAWPPARRRRAHRHLTVLKPQPSRIPFVRTPRDSALVTIEVDQIIGTLWQYLSPQGAPGRPDARISCGCAQGTPVHAAPPGLAGLACEKTKGGQILVAAWQCRAF